MASSTFPTSAGMVTIIMELVVGGRYEVGFPLLLLVLVVPMVCVAPTALVGVEILCCERYNPNG